MNFCFFYFLFLSTEDAIEWSGCTDSNRGPRGPEPRALPTELHPEVDALYRLIFTLTKSLLWNYHRVSLRGRPLSTIYVRIPFMDQAPSETLRYAKDEQCSRCEKPAEVFVGVADPDMPQHPMCAKCAEQYRLEVMMVLCGMEPRDFVKKRKKSR